MSTTSGYIGVNQTLKSLYTILKKYPNWGIPQSYILLVWVLVCEPNMVAALEDFAEIICDVLIG